MSDTSSPNVVAMPVLKGGSIEDTLTGFAPQMEQYAHLGKRVEQPVTILAVEVRGWDRVAERVCDARATTLLDVTLERVLEAVEVLGGREVKLGGDKEKPSLSAVFDGDKHALRAVVAAKAAADAASMTLHPSMSEHFDACVGVSSGTVVEAHVNGSGIEFSSSGTVRLFAVRLCEFAGPGQVFLSESTYGQVGPFLDVLALGAVRTSADGVAQEAYALRGIVPDASVQG